MKFPLTITVHRHYHLFKEKEQEPTLKEKIGGALLWAGIIMLVLFALHGKPAVEYVPIFIDKQPHETMACS